MKLLIIGGTKFLGRAIAQAALEQGHDLTLFNRGQTQPDLFPQATHLRGNRRTDLSALTDSSWDAVIDTCAYIPHEVDLVGHMLRGRVGCYALISTISVYQQGNFTQAGTHEDSPVEVLDDPSNETITGESYGGLKALCEARAQHHFKQAAFIIRPGFIVGPHDPTFRFHYWVARAAQGGTMLAPGQPDQPLQVIDVRDLAAWTLLGIAHGLGGVYNATGPIEPLHWGDFLQTACQVAGAGTQLAWVDESFLLTQAVEPFATLPLWPPAELNGVHQTSIAKAVAGGLTFRPLEQTIRASLPFALEMARALPDSDSSLRAEREADLLAAWHLYLQNGASA